MVYLDTEELESEEEVNHLLPKGWVWAKLGDICLEPQYGWTTSASVKGNAHLLRTTDITSGKIDWNSVPFCKDEPPEIDKYLLKDGDVVISRAGSVGYSHLVKNPRKAIFASYLIRFNPLIEADYFAFFLKSPLYWQSISKKSIGIAIPNVNATKLKQVIIPIPPLLEQRRITAKIEELFTKLDAGVESLKKAKAQLKHYRQSILKSAVEGKLTEEWRAIHKDEIKPASVLLGKLLKERKNKLKEKWKEPDQPDTSNLGNLPNSWTWATLSQLGELNRGKSKHRPRDAAFLYGGPYPFIQTGDIRQANGVIYHYEQTYSEEGLKQSRLWSSGTLCITIAANIADTAILGINACFPDSVAGFLTDPSYCNIRYIELFMRTAKASLEKYAPATAQKNINIAILSKVAIPTPSLREQKQIVEETESRLSITDEVESVINAELKRAERLRQSILKQAFSGELVPQNPSDEPASILLERIKQGKNKQEGESRKKPINNQKQLKLL